MKSSVLLSNKNISKGSLILNSVAFACGVASLVVGLSAVSSQSKLEKKEKKLIQPHVSQTLPQVEVEENEKTYHEVYDGKPSTGRSAVDNFLWCIGLLVGAILIAVAFGPPYMEPTYKKLDVEIIREQLPAFATEINELVEFNNIPSDSKITIFVGESLAQSKVVNSETQQSYLLDLPRIASVKDGSLDYISVTGTVDDYTLTFSNPDMNIAATYTSKTGVTTVNDDQKGG